MGIIKEITENTTKAEFIKTVKSLENDFMKNNKGSTNKSIRLRALAIQFARGDQTNPNNITELRQKTLDGFDIDDKNFLQKKMTANDFAFFFKPYLFTINDIENL